jgi:hypothetical protein
MPLFKRKQKEGQTSRPKTGEISFKNTPRKTTSSKTSQLTRYEVPQKTLDKIATADLKAAIDSITSGKIDYPKSISKSLKTKKIK